MKKRKNRLLIPVFTLLVMALVTSCVKDNWPNSLADDEIANVNLILNSRAENKDANEGIKTLRLLIIDNDGTINFNRKVNNADLSSNPVTIKLLGLSVGTGYKNFYVIANEESIGLDAQSFEQIYPEQSKLQDGWKNSLKSFEVDTDGECFYKQASDIVEYGLPITGFNEGFKINTESDNNIVNINISYAVSKIKLKFINERLTTETVENITFLNVEPEGGTTLFDVSEPLSTGISYAELGNVQIPAATNGGPGEASTILYLYENKMSSESEYSFTANWNDKSQNVSFAGITFTDENGNTETINSLPRGRQLDITVTLKPGKLEVSVIVIPWGTKDITIPPFF